MIPYKAMQVPGHISMAQAVAGGVCQILLWALMTRGEDIEVGRRAALSLGCEMGVPSNT